MRLFFCFKLARVKDIETGTRCQTEPVEVVLVSLNLLFFDKLRMTLKIKHIKPWDY